MNFDLLLNHITTIGAFLGVIGGIITLLRVWISLNSFVSELKSTDERLDYTVRRVDKRTDDLQGDLNHQSRYLMSIISRLEGRINALENKGVAHDFTEDN